MRSDRLYAITLYLLNHGRVSAAQLASVMEVSVRTIQRDMDALCHAGVPVVAETGRKGGYCLAEGFRMDSQLATREEFLQISTALKGLSTALNDTAPYITAEKAAAMAGGACNDLLLDLSVLRESDGELISLLRRAIAEHHVVSFEYTNAEGKQKRRIAEPVAVVYRWYSWYLLAYCLDKLDYRTFKLVRMGDVQVTDMEFRSTHASAEEILARNDRGCPEVTQVLVRCRSDIKGIALEYLNGRVECEYDDGYCELILNVIEREAFWLGVLLSMGDGIEVLEPQRIRTRAAEAAKKAAALYEKSYIV